MCSLFMQCFLGPKGRLVLTGPCCAGLIDTWMEGGPLGIWNFLPDMLDRSDKENSFMKFHPFWTFSCCGLRIVTHSKVACYL